MFNPIIKLVYKTRLSYIRHMFNKMCKDVLHEVNGRFMDNINTSYSIKEYEKENRIRFEMIRGEWIEFYFLKDTDFNPYYILFHSSDWHATIKYTCYDNPKALYHLIYDFYTNQFWFHRKSYACGLYSFDEEKYRWNTKVRNDCD